MKGLLLAILGLVAVDAFSVKKYAILDQLHNRIIPKEAESLTGQALVDYVNKNQSFFKVAPSKFSRKAMKAKLMDAKYVVESRSEEEASIVIDATIPESFDARKRWPHCSSISTIRDQSDCGSCWAVAAAEAMSDRVCIASHGKTQLALSADDVLSCCGMACGDGCQGGYPLQAWNYWQKRGLCTGGSYASKSGCKPYPIPPCGHHRNETYYGECSEDGVDTPACTHKCVAGYPKSYKADKHYGKSAYDVPKSVQAIQKEIMTHGPVEAAYYVYEDFFHYKGGVYTHTAGPFAGGHAVKIIGWGVEDNTPYWLVANSWNTDWGESGYFRIVRGANECGIESAIVAGLPK